MCDLVRPRVIWQFRQPVFEAQCLAGSLHQPQVKNSSTKLAHLFYSYYNQAAGEAMVTSHTHKES
jgi:hypothetical protein